MLKLPFSLLLFIMIVNKIIEHSMTITSRHLVKLGLVHHHVINETIEGLELLFALIVPILIETGVLQLETSCSLDHKFQI